MARLRDKLNVLLQSSVRGVRRDPAARERKAPALARQDRTLAALRQQIDAALDEDDRLVQQLAVLRQEIAGWDEEADRLLRTGETAAARQRIRQLQLKRQQQAMQEAVLYQHRHAVAELIQRANVLEATLAEARRAQGGQAEGQELDPSLTARLQIIRERVAQAATQPAPPAAPAAPPDEQAIDDDLAQRRARLSL